MPNVPQPKFERDINKIVEAYEQALKEVQAELNSLFLTDFERAQIIAVEKQIRNILSDTSKYAEEWATAAMTTAGLEGVAATIFALELVDTYEDALKIAKFNRANKRLIDAAIADTQADLLAVTQNVERQAVLAIRRATAEAMRLQLAKGVNATQNLSKAIRDQIVKAADVSIIDAASRKWRLSTYCDMLARTKMQQAHREASITEGLSEGALYGRISNHSAKDACARWESKIVKLTPDAPGDFVYVGDIPRNELWHPNCRHILVPVRRLDRLPADIRQINGIN